MCVCVLDTCDPFWYIPVWIFKIKFQHPAGGIGKLIIQLEGCHQNYPGAHMMMTVSL